MASSAIDQSQRLLTIISNPRLRAQHLPHLDSEELCTINSQVEEVALAASVWCRARPFMNPDLIVPFTLIMCVLFPDMTVEETLLRVQANLWVLAIDDLLDDPELPTDQSEAVSKDCRAVALCPLGLEAPVSAYGHALMEIKMDLAQYPRFAALAPVWGGALVRLVDGMMFELGQTRRNQTRLSSAQMPGLDEYLYFGRSSIGLPFIWITSLLMKDHTCDRSLSDLIELAENCGALMRLSNDLRSYDDEARIGKFNAVDILRPALADTTESLAQGRSAVRSLMQEMRHQLGETTAKTITPSNIAHRFVRGTDFGVDLYAMTDFRTFSSGLMD